MIWLGFLLLSLVVLAPVLLAQIRIRLRGRRDAALNLYRAQLIEVMQEGERGRLGPQEQSQARLEIERRLLATAAITDGAPPSPGRLGWGLPVAVLLLPVLALALYLPGGSPLLPAAPLAPRIAAAQEQQRQDRAMLTLLEAKIATLDPHGEEARQGYVLLGNLRADMGDAAGAASAWGKALAIRADPQLAALKAEADAAVKAHPPGP